MTVSWARNLLSKGWMLLVVGILSGCVQLPVDGPGYRDIHGGAAATVSNGRDPLLIYTSRDAVDYNYALIDINPLVLSVLHEIPPISFLKTFGKRRGPTPIIRVGAGDVLQTSIFEATSGGLFVPSEAAGRLGNYVTLPTQTVGGNGTISVPYAGPVQAAGRTVPEIQRDIESKLASRAIEPQVLVNMTEQNAAAVTLIGDTGQSRIKMTGTGERILDMISKAGGAGVGPDGRFAGYELFVTLQRKGQTATVQFTRLINDPKENIFVAPGDVIYVHREHKTFVAFGALASVGGGGVVAGGETTGLNGLFRFGQERLALNEALAKAGGLTDLRANPSQVFLYRPEHRETLEKMGVNLSKFAPGQQLIPTVYRANFRDPSSFFFAQRFEMRDKDVIYVANSDASEVLKFLTYVTAWTSTASSTFVDARTVSDIAAGAHVFGTTGAAVVVGGP